MKGVCTMKEERMAILSMIEKGVISVDEAERLLNALNSTEKNSFEKFMTKAGGTLNSFAKTVGEKTEKIVEEAKPVVKTAGEKVEKVVEEVKPSVKKAADTLSEKADMLKDKIKERKYGSSDEAEEEPVTEESDFEENVVIMPVGDTQADKDSVEEAEEKKQDEE